MGKKIVITGSGGYIGSVATYIFLQNDFEVIAIDNFSRGFRQPLEVLQKKFGQDKLRIYEADLNSNLSKIFDQEENIEAIVHYGALCLVSESMEQPQKYFQNNIGGTLNLLNTAIAR